MAETRQEVIAGGDPQALGIPVFVVGSIALGFALLSYPATLDFTVVLSIISVGTGLFLLICTIWSLLIGASLLASVFGIFSAFWLSFTALLLGAILHPDWFTGAAKADLASIAPFCYTWAIVIFILSVALLRLPIIYPLIGFLIVIALVLVANTQLSTAGIVVFIFALLGAYVMLSQLFAAAGGKALPYGPVLLK
jgi:succinate-acetate transporter protein